ncbi:MAG: methionyl-tRNA formyltransferase, partial [Mycobacterium sp.]
LPTRSPVGTLADQAGLEVLTPRRASEPDFLIRLSALAPDCCPVVGYGALVPGAALGIPRHGWVNLHFSLLPAWRGAAPVQAAIAAGDTVTGATTFQIEPSLDSGPVYGVVTEAIRPTDTAGDLLDRLAISGAALLSSTLDGIADGALTAVPQPADGVSFAPKVTVEEARVRWDLPAEIVERQIRAVTPHPGAWTLIGDLRVKLGPLHVDIDPSNPLQPGQIHIDRHNVWIGTGSEPVQLGGIQPPGKKFMKAVDWARGARLDSAARAT